MTPVHGELGKRGGNTSHCHSRELKKCGQLNVKCWGGGQHSARNVEMQNSQQKL